ncbi:hypothetical protein BX661DRAFT_175393, partial [Kickxella alabastrina]|uniref:uncharacterized protein n=1 Tax=Kickxella alabastrina TaxID=61397 RepID=UPI0022206A8D
MYIFFLLVQFENTKERGRDIFIIHILVIHQFLFYLFYLMRHARRTQRKKLKKALERGAGFAFSFIFISSSLSLSSFFSFSVLQIIIISSYTLNIHFLNYYKTRIRF